MANQSPLPPWSHVDLDTINSILLDGIDKLRDVRNSANLTRSDRIALDAAFDDVRLAHTLAKLMNGKQEDILEGAEDAEAPTTP